MLHVNAGRAPLDVHGDDPEDYPRAGYLFNAAARAGLSYRDYGAMLRLAGYQPEALSTPAPSKSRNPRATPPPSPLGGFYTLDVPALAALANHVDLNYPGWNPAISERAARGRVRERHGPPRTERRPTRLYVRVVADGTGQRRRRGRRSRARDDNGLSLSYSPLVVDGGFYRPRRHRARRARSREPRSQLCDRGVAAREAGVRRTSASLAGQRLKTEEELLGLAPLGLPDLLATDMADFFGAVPYPSPYHAIP